MARPISMKTLDVIVEQGATFQFVGVGPKGRICNYWIVVALPFDVEEEAFVLVTSNNPSIRTFGQKDAAATLCERYPYKKHIQTVRLPLAGSIESPEDIYLMKREEIEQLHPQPSICRIGTVARIQDGALESPLGAGVR